MTGYTPLFSSILTSTVWLEDHATVRVWVTMMALKDANGFVDASIPGLAETARVTLEECQSALDKFLAPDPFSRTKEHEGRRIEERPSGWFMLNHDAYKKRVVSRAAYYRARRARLKDEAQQLRNGMQQGVTPPQQRATPPTVPPTTTVPEDLLEDSSRPVVNDSARLVEQAQEIIRSIPNPELVETYIQQHRTENAIENDRTMTAPKYLRLAQEMHDIQQGKAKKDGHLIPKAGAHTWKRALEITIAKKRKGGCWQNHNYFKTALLGCIKDAVTGRDVHQSVFDKAKEGGLFVFPNGFED